MYQGSMVALVTPMRDDDHLVDEASLRKLVDYHIENHTDALVIAGTTGESATLSHSENCDVIRIAVEQAAGQIPIIGGTGSNSTAEAINLTRCAKSVGANACLLVTPYYNKPTQEGLYRHYRTIAEAVDIPLILYNVPGRTSCDIQPATVKRLAEIDNIIGIKEALADMERVKALLAFAGDDFKVISGDDATAIDLMLLGGHGVISVTANVAPKMMHDMCMAVLRGDRTMAEALNNQLMPLHQALFAEPNPIPVKWAVHKQGLIDNSIRLPLLSLSEVHHAALYKAMKTAGVL